MQRWQLAWLWVLSAFLLASLRPVVADDLTAIANAHLRQRLGDAPGRLVINVKASPAQADRARQCPRLSAFDPPGARFAGRGYVGIACATPPAWRTWVPVRTQRFGAVAVSAHALARGRIVTATDLKRIEVDIAALPSDAVIESAGLIGKQLTHSIAAGQSIRSHQIQMPRLVRRGDPVVVVIDGNGYQASNGGIALAAGGLADQVEVRMPSGTVLSGRVSAAGRVVVKR